LIIERTVGYAARPPSKAKINKKTAILKIEVLGLRKISDIFINFALSN